MRTAFAAFVLVLLATVPATSAHRVDEFLQRTFLTFGKDTITAELYLTPGVIVLPAVIGSLDSNRDGVITEFEQQSYVDRVLRDLAISLDDVPIKPRILVAEFPTIAEMKEGLGCIHLVLELGLPPVRQSSRLLWENRHFSAIAAYQINAMTPADPRLHLARDHRSYSQSRYEVEFTREKM